MKALLSFFAAGLALSSFGAETTEAIMNRAYANAAQKRQNVLVIFHASWCGWCKRLDRFLSEVEEGKAIAAGLEIVHITVLENEKHKADENPGGLDLLKSLNGEKAGLPFMAIMDGKTRKMVINSLMIPGNQGSNTGYPAAAEEIHHFEKMLKAGAKNISTQSRTRAIAWLRANAPK